jgi:hypothetical protein
MKSIAALCLTIVAAVTLAAQTPTMRPGRYAVTMQMSMPNMPVAMPEIKSEQCISDADLKKDPHAWIPNASPDPRMKEACKMSDYKVTGQTVTWSMSCPGQQAITGTGEMTIKGDTYAGVMKMTTPQGEFTTKISGQRTGDCSK